jgi:hypothetical protein
MKLKHLLAATLLAMPSAWYWWPMRKRPDSETVKAPEPTPPSEDPPKEDLFPRIVGGIRRGELQLVHASRSGRRTISPVSVAYGPADLTATALPTTSPTQTVVINQVGNPNHILYGVAAGAASVVLMTQLAERRAARRLEEDKNKETAEKQRNSPSRDQSNSPYAVSSAGVNTDNSISRETFSTSVGIPTLSSGSGGPQSSNSSDTDSSKSGSWDAPSSSSSNYSSSSSDSSSSSTDYSSSSNDSSSSSSSSSSWD